MIKCIAVDDEPLALSKLTSYISRVPFLELTTSCQDAFEAMEVLKKEQIDLIFLDINMPDLNGVEFARSLTNKPLLIFTTAYSEHAIEGFRLDAVDYLLKPFEFHELLKAAEKARKLIEANRKSGTSEQMQAQEDALFVKSDYKNVRINISEIKYIEGMSEYIRIFVEGEKKPIISLLSMKKIEDRLPANLFMRVHKSYIVNLKKITEVSRLRIVFDKETYIPVGESYKERFLEYIDSMSIGR